MSVLGLEPESDSDEIGAEEALTQEGQLLTAWLSSMSISHLYTIFILLSSIHSYLELQIP